MEAKSISFNFRARYYMMGTPGANITQLWFVCHGYGQLAQYFLRKFKLLEDHQHMVVAPEGLSRFYLEGFSGRVGAAWMTKEDRETDILNYCNYLDTVGKSILEQLSSPVKITLLGFSQGAATASRWITTTDIKIDRFVLWAGTLPKDLNSEAAKAKLAQAENFVVYGKDDPFLTQEILEEQTFFYKQAGISPEIITFEGGHEIKEEVLKGFKE